MTTEPKQPPAHEPDDASGGARDDPGHDSRFGGGWGREEDALEHALDVLWGSREGMLAFDEHTVPAKFVSDPESGRLVMSAPVAALLAAQVVLFVPEETEDALQLLVSLEEVKESAVTDRWQVYHGEPEHVRWASVWIDSGKHGPWVFDGEALMLPNPLARAEPALCRRVNSDRAALARVCQRRAGVVVPDPLCVGIDPRGMHVRARFGVVRVRFERREDDAGAAEKALERMLREG